VSVVTRSESADDLVDVLGRKPRPTGRIGLTQRSQVEHFGERGLDPIHSTGSGQVQAVFIRNASI
jgi:hypothetical protein